jgi:hypothetical protein
MLQTLPTWSDPVCRHLCSRLHTGSLLMRELLRAGALLHMAHRKVGHSSAT